MRRYNQPAHLWFGPWYRKSPYFEATQRYGCQAYDIYNHTLLPAGYSGVVRKPFLDPQKELPKTKVIVT